jgi:hypothetical protein
MNNARAKQLEKQLLGQPVEGWTIEASINHGKSAAVFKASSEDGYAAVKVFDSEIIDKHGAEVQMERIEREKTLVNKVHPNLVKVYGGGFWSEQQLFYVIMEFIGTFSAQSLNRRQMTRSFRYTGRRKMFQPMSCRVLLWWRIIRSQTFSRGRLLFYRHIDPSPRLSGCYRGQFFASMRDLKSPRPTEKSAVSIGIILAEVLTNAVGRGFIDSLPMTAYETTYSFVASRAIALGYDEAILGYVSRGWQSVRELGENRGRKLPADLLLNVWTVVRFLAIGERARSTFSNQPGATVDILRACDEISERGHLGMYSLERLSRGRVHPQLFADTARIPREQRVIAFESAIQHLNFGPPGDPAIDFVVGYLASLVGDGSLEHAHLVFPLQSRFPTAMLWYGVCASLVPSTRVMTDYGHLGVRIWRMLERYEHLLSPPNCDISLAELEVILRGQPQSRAFRQTHASSLRVELAPGVSTVIRPIGNQPVTEQTGLFGEESRQPMVEAERLKELVYSLKSSLSVAESLLSKANTSNGGEASSRSKRKR